MTPLFIVKLWVVLGLLAMIVIFFFAHHNDPDHFSEYSTAFLKVTQKPHPSAASTAETTTNLPESKNGPQKALHIVREPTAIIHVSERGSIVLRLRPDVAPKTVRNFARMASRDGVFNRSCFYRYEKGFVLQGGLHCNNPPPNRRKGKTVEFEYNLPNEKNSVALARAGGDLKSGGTEFFINLANNSRGLGPTKKKGGYAVFATVVEGFDVIQELKKLPTKKAGLTLFRNPQPVIERIEIVNYEL